MFERLIRPLRESSHDTLFDLDPDWRQEWWGMPDFSMGDARPQRRITIQFMTDDAVKEFAKQTGLRISPRTDSLWYPEQPILGPGEFEYHGPKSNSKYPICIPSKGRWHSLSTCRALLGLGVDFKVFVEETEADKYRQALGDQYIVEMPFHDLGQGSIPARNFIWEWAREREYKRHWVVDDNIRSFVRLNINRRLRVRGGAFFRAMEDFVDRYENVALAGPHHLGFAPDRNPNMAPYILNSRIYSCILIDTMLTERWRGRYNEDTDLSLRVLKQGLCTVLFRALLMDKADTVKGAKDEKIKGRGGNAEHVYTPGEYRLPFATSLKEQHPDCVEVVWKFGRWHHYVDYSRFKKNKLIRKPDVVPIATNDEYGMRLVRIT